MNPVFEDKYRQLSIDTLEAFGIRLQSRYAKASEMREMLDFAEMVAKKELHTLVASLFYDSGACLCEIKTVEPLSDEEEQAIFKIARHTITQFQWNDTVHHRFGIDAP